MASPNATIPAPEDPQYTCEKCIPYDSIWWICAMVLIGAALFGIAIISLIFYIRAYRFANRTPNVAEIAPVRRPDISA